MALSRLLLLNLIACMPLMVLARDASTAGSTAATERPAAASTTAPTIWAPSWPSAATGA